MIFPFAGDRSVEDVGWDGSPVFDGCWRVANPPQVNNLHHKCGIISFGGQQGRGTP
jgi:hypothetical protein